MVKKIVLKILIRRLSPIRVNPGPNNLAPSSNFEIPSEQLKVVIYRRRTVNANRNTCLKKNGIDLVI